ncbi:hypothetical protein H5410_039655 [Solanum commersonii]|uniref:Uncharacterized protein n=1 Tax=Solanum commersonii TaxID=4109 RepID=A0A9J5XMR0_SOLCO|nr:hypothetical protein H5410_039655 [Solanum commersonii]
MKDEIFLYHNCNYRNAGNKQKPVESTLTYLPFGTDARTSSKFKKMLNLKFINRYAQIKLGVTCLPEIYVKSESRILNHHSETMR